MRVVIEYDIMHRGYRIAAFQDREDGSTEAYRITLTKESVEEGRPLPYTLVPKTQSEVILKALAAGLQEAGFIPRTEYKGEGQLEAQTKHLADMQHIAFQLLESKK